MKKQLLFFFVLLSGLPIWAQNYNMPNNLVECGAYGTAQFDLTVNTAHVLSNDGPENFTVLYYLTHSDALNSNEAIADPTSFTNLSNPQEIYMRIINNATMGMAIFTFTVRVDPLVDVPNQTFMACDDDEDGYTAVDLSSVATQIWESSETTPGNLGISFYESLSDAQALANPLPWEYMNPVPFNQTIYAVTMTPGTACSSITTIEIMVQNCGSMPCTAVPFNVAATAASTSSANVSWFQMNGSSELVVVPAGNPAPTVTTVGIAASGSPFTVTGLDCGSYDIYVRKVCESGMKSEWSQPVTFNTSFGGSPLEAMTQCDDNQDGEVEFDLTVAAGQINTTNPLSYYANSVAPENEIDNPTAFSVAIEDSGMTVYVSEDTGSCQYYYPMQLNINGNCNISAFCSTANSLCGALGAPFSNTVGVPSAEDGNDYGCLNTTPNPTWFYLPVSGAGNINLKIEQNSNIAFTGAAFDVDYIVYGPFANPTAACSGLLTAANTVSCSYSSAAVEYPAIANAQPGQFYLIMVTNYANQPGFIRITEMGTTEGTISCTGFRLNAFLDNNGNAVQDTGEPNFPLGQFQYERNGNGNIHHIISPTGKHSIYDPNSANTYSLGYVIDPAYTASYSLTTANYPNVSVPASAMQTFDFPITIAQAYNDLAVSIVPVEAPRPGFAYSNKILYTNMGSQSVASGTVTFTKDQAVTITAVSQSGTVATTNGFTYNFTNLQPFESREIIVTMQVPVLPEVAIDDYLTNTATIQPAGSESILENNETIASQIIIGSYDPNDKMESRGEEILFSDFSAEDYLYYTVRFENTGTASAINVRISDVLDSQLDETSIRMIESSHSYVLDRVGNSLTWKFDNIQLPPSTGDASTGKGYVMFGVKPRAGYAVGDVIQNTASIFFDFNPAIVTNTFYSTFVAQLRVDESQSGNFVCYPNPANTQVTVSLKDTSDAIAAVAVYDLLGKVILKQKTTLATETIDVTAMAKGVYLLEVTTASNAKTVKKLVIQ